MFEEGAMAKQQPAASQESRSKRDKQQETDPGQGQNGPQDEAARYERELARYLQERIKPGLNRSAIPLLARSIAKELAHREHLDGASENAEAEEEHSAEAEDEPSAETEDEHSAETQDEHSAEAEDEPSAEAEDAETEDEHSAETQDEHSAEAEDAETNDEPRAEAEDEDSGEAEDEDSGEAEDEPSAESEASPDFEADMHELQAELGDDWILRFSVQGDDAWLTAEKDDGSQRVEAPTASVISEAVELLKEEGGRST
jgi:hypothetical protein